jgi:hypothetical protein
MSTLAEIEAAADQLPAAQQHQLLLHLILQIRKNGAELPPPREYTPEQIAAWAAADEADFQRFQAGA